MKTMKNKRTKALLVSFFLTALVLVGFGYSRYSSADVPMMDAKTFSALTPQQALEASKVWHHTGKATVKVLPDHIEARLPNNERAKIALNGEFLLSIAPYINKTHNCTFHVPTGCQGELVEQPMHVMVTDKNTGKVVKNEMVTTGKDGFVDLWLPQGPNYEVMFHYNNMMAMETLPTQMDSRTCITTMRFKAGMSH
ncbi:CueP family metal-binding protein [Vibrio stylophorae]|nr:CueP family metal-binding protein [Vibrio stylophorae]